MNWNKINHPYLSDEAQEGSGGEGGSGAAAGSDPSTAIFEAGAPEVDAETLKLGHNHVKPAGTTNDEGTGGGDDDGGGDGGEGEGGDGGKPAATQISPETLSQIIRESVSLATQHQPGAGAPGAQPPQQLSEADLRKFFKFPVIDENRFAQVFGMKPENPEQLKNFDALITEAMYAAARMAAYQGEQKLKEVEGRYAPLRQTIEEQRAERDENKFFGKFKHLKNHKDIVLMVRAQAIQQGKKFDTLEQAETYLAKTTEAVIKRLAPNANLGQSNARPNGGRPQPPATNVGGHSSHGRGGQPAGPRTAMERSTAIFKVGVK